MFKCNQGEHMNDKKVLRSFRLEAELDEWLKKSAKVGDRSLNAQINRTLRQAKGDDKESDESEKQKP